MPAQRLLSRAARLAGAALIALVAVLGLAAGQAAAKAPLPSADPFYDAPAGLGTLMPGAVIRSRSITVNPPVGVTMPNTAFQVLYRTTDQQGEPVATAATVIIPAKRPAKNRKLVSWQIAYDGLSEKCQPSYTLHSARYAQAGFEVAQLAAAISKGWTVVTSDYEGPSNTWIAGRMAGQATLDGIRAAEAMPESGLDGVATPVGLMGYSGGGHATAWANELAATYAPELHIVGATQGGVPANPALLAESLNGGPFAGVLFAAIAGLRAAYPDVDLDQYINARGQRLWAQLGKQCITDFALAHVGQRIQSYSTVPDIFAIPAIKAISDENTLGQRAASVPTLMYHAVKDELVAFPGAKRLSDQYCAMGAKLQWIQSNNDDHVTLAIRMSARAIAYMSQRFSGAPAPDTCPPVPVG